MISDLFEGTKEVYRDLAGMFEEDISTIMEFEILTGYEAAASYEGSCWILLMGRKTGKLYEIHASHCSCYGFERQWCPEETTLEYLMSEHVDFGYGCPLSVEDMRQVILLALCPLSAEVRRLKALDD